MPHGSYKSITDVTRDLFYFSLSLARSFPSPLSLCPSLSLCFPLPKLRAIMNASIFYLVPSARPYCSRPFLLPLPRRSCPYFLVQFFFFQLLSPVIGRLLMARDCLSRLSGTAFPRPTGGPADCAHIPRPLPSAIVSATRASPS